MDYIPPFGSTDPEAPYVDRNTSTATRGSAVPATFFNDIQAELLAIIDGAGLARDPNALQIADAIRSGGLSFAEADGTANALTAVLALAPAVLRHGMPLRLKLTATNTGPATLNLNGLGARAIVTLDGSTLAGGEMRAGQIREFVFDNVLGEFVLLTMPRAATVDEVEAGLRGDVFVSPLTKWTARQAYFNARQAATMSLASSVVTKVTNLTTVSGSYFSDGGSSYTGSTFTCGSKDAGVWLIGGYLAVPVAAAATIRNYIGINGVTASFQSTYAPSSGTYGVPQFRMLKIAAGDQIDIRAFQNSGAPVDIGGEFSGVRIAN